MRFNRLFTVLALVAATGMGIVSCDTQNDPIKENTPPNDNNGGDQNGGDPNGGNPNQNDPPHQTIPDCFVYYKDAMFLFINTDYENKKTKVWWEVKDYNQTTKVASITQTKCSVTGNEASDFKLRKESDGTISYSGDGTSWKSRNNTSKDWDFMFISKATKPSGCYGNIENKVTASNVTGPNGRSVQGCMVCSDYKSTRDDSFMYDETSHETWSTECGLVKSYKHISNMKSYPVYSYQADYDLVSYYIPMPDGTERAYAPNEPDMKPVTNLSATYSDLTKTSSKCDWMTFTWEDKVNSGVFKYNLYNMFQEDGSWYVKQVFADNNHDLYGWFIGNPDSEYNKNNMRGNYGTRSGSGVRFQAGMYYFYVTAESLYSETQFDDISEIIGIQLGGGNSASSTYELTHNSTVSTRALLESLPEGAEFPGGGSPMAVSF